MLLNTKVLRGRKKVFDKLRRKWLPNTEVVSLLKPDSAANAFVTVMELYEGWWFTYSDFRKNFLLEIASEDETLEENIGESTHIDLGTDGVFVIVKADVTPPVGTDVTWKIACERSFQRAQTRPLY